MADPSDSENLPEPSANVSAEPARVFISYASPDAAVAQTVCSALETAGFPCWIAPRDVVPGTLYADGIIRAITDSTILVVILSKHAVASAHVGKELERASSKRHPIIALRTDTTPLTPAFEYFLSESQWIDAAASGADAATAKLVAAVRLHLVPGSSRSLHPSPEAPAIGRKAAPLRRSWVIAAAVIAVTLVALLAGKFWLAKHTTVEQPTTVATNVISDKSIAVLPFADMSEKKDQEYFADGMAEEIIDRLAKASDLHVPGRTSSFYFKGKPTKIPDIARELGVANVLEGSVRRSGDHLRVTVQLIRADSGYHRWSETYDRDLRDVFTVQDEIANAVAQALQITLMGGPLTRPKGGTQNLEAYQLYLRGVSAAVLPTESSLAAASGYLDRALKLDPAFGLAWSRMAQVSLIETDNGILASKEGYERTRRLSLRALEVSPELADAHATLQYVHRAFDWDWAASEHEGRLALNMDPNNQFALMYAGMLSSTLGHWGDAERQLRAAVDRDPLFTYAHWNLGTELYLAGRFSDAEATFRRLIEIAPGFSWAYTNLGLTLLAEGKPDAALSIVQQDQEEADRMQVLPMVLQAVGRKAEADQSLNTLIAKFADTAAYWVAANYAYRGDRDLAFQWLERAYQQKDNNLVTIVGEPLFKNLANDPRYKVFLRKMDLPE